MATVLLIEDDATTAWQISGYLRGGGHQVRVAGNGVAGLALFAQEAADLVIADIFIPEKDGLEVIRELRARSPELPVIAISGGGSVPAGDVLRLARVLGASEVLAKPVSRSDLLSAVGRCLPAQG